MKALLKDKLTNENGIVNCFLLVFLTGFLLIITKGYSNITETKYWYYKICAASLILMVVFCCINRRVKVGELFKGFQLTISDIALICFQIAITIGTILSDSIAIALWGMGGWYTGYLFFTLTFCVYFVIRLFLKDLSFTYLPPLVALDIACILAIFDRYSIHIIPISYRPDHFLSTIGNIDWFAGILSVIFPLLFGYSVLSSQKNYFVRASTVLAFLTTIFLGCDAPILYLLVSTAGVGLLAMLSKKSLSRFCIYVGVAILVLRVLNYPVTDNIIPGYQYNDFFILLQKCDNYRYTIAGVLLIILGLAVRLVKYYAGRKVFKFFGVVFLVCIILSIIAGLVLLSNIFLISYGNSRSLLIQSGLTCLNSMGPFQRLFGVGPDCFNSLAMSIPSVSQMYDVYIADTVTNCHCEPINCLITYGLFGTISYYIFYISCIVILVRRHLDSSDDYGNVESGKIVNVLCAVSIGSFLATNLVSFITVFSYPLMIIYMAIALRKDRSEDEDVMSVSNL